MDSHYKYKISNIGVVYEDNWLLILDKPSGLLTIPTPKNETRTLTSVLNEDLEKQGKLYRLHPCHRLDRETSGLIIYAKGKSIQKKMMDLFKYRKIKKTYIAFVHRILSKNQGKINTPIEGQPAITKYRIIQRRKNFTIVEVVPLTGRTNQIRLHFSQMGYPIVGEAKFAFRRDFKLKAKRLCLYASSLEFVHPITKEVISLNTKIPPDFEEFLKKH